jgi:hypothetical protein
MDLQNNQRRQRYVSDKGIEREMRVLRDFFGGAETHSKQKANKEQHDVVHCIFSERLPVAEVGVGNESLELNRTGCAPKNFLNAEALSRSRSSSPR